MGKPDHILYGTHERPPPATLALLAMQQVLVLSIYLVSPVIVAQAASMPLAGATDLISHTMIGLGIASILQVRRNGPLGAGLLAIPAPQDIMVPGCVIAARLGGLPMVTGLLLGCGIIEMILSRFLRRLRGIMPTELSGLIVLVTGLGVAQAGMDNVVGSVAEGGSANWLTPTLLATGTLAVMVGCSIWARGALRALGAVVGLTCGYVGGLAAGIVDPVVLDQVRHAPLLRIPSLPSGQIAFDSQLLLPLLVTALAITLNSTGALTAAQRLADKDWKRQDQVGLSRGLLADGLGTVITALIGGGGIAASGSSVGLTANARATSLAIGYVTAAGFIGLALVPGFALLILTVPRPVLGAALVFLSCSLLISGVSIMSSRLLDTRKTFTLGIAFAFAVATPALTRAGAILPEWMSPVVASPLLAAALVALLLNPILRLGIREQVSLDIPPEGLRHEDVARFVARAGAAWGARREVIDQAQVAIAECLDTLSDSELSTSGSRLTLGFNELVLDARFTWRGNALPLSNARPTREELLTSDDAPARLAGYLISRLATRVRSRSRDGVAELHLAFDH